MNKRHFIRTIGTGCLALGGLNCPLKGIGSGSRVMNSGSNSDTLWKWSKECMFYEMTPRGVKCLVCPNECTLKPGEESTCRNRVHKNEKLYSIAYGNPCAIQIDPIEKKPLLHFLPSSYTYSIATAGCNLACLNCQNYTISQTSPRKTNNYDLMPDRVVEECKKNECRSISYTYSEPITFYEYMYDTSVLAHQEGIKNILVSNGYINEVPLRQLCKVIDAANIDLKSFSETTYLKLNAGKLKPILSCLKILKEENVWLEITNLVIPSWTDDLDMIKKMCDWLADNGLENNPLHFSRFQPLYKLTQLPPTPAAILEKSREIAINAGMHYVYVGNVPTSQSIHTYCPRCKKMIVERKGYMIISKLIHEGKCSNCGEPIPGCWN
jgi:pyruvate formate lyase activating enzyme